MKRALLRTPPGRAIVFGAIVKAVVFAAGLAAPVPALLRVVDTAASIALAAGGAYFLAQGVAFAQRRLLWRVRRKLIISYIFIGFIPSLLIVAFFLLGGLFLFSNVSSYMVQSRVNSVVDRVAAIAGATAAEMESAGGANLAAILARRQAGVEKEFPGISLAAVPMAGGCGAARRADIEASGSRAGPLATAGPWAHV